MGGLSSATGKPATDSSPPTTPTYLPLKAIKTFLHAKNTQKAFYRRKDVKFNEQMKTQIAHQKTDVLVIGSGGAGLRAAIAAHEKGANVLVVGKSGFGNAHTVLAQGGINAALGNSNPKDNWIVHAADTIKEGGEISNPKMVETLCRNAPQAVFELEEFGTNFAKDKNGKILQRTFGAHSYPRTCFVGDHTGKQIIESLVRKSKKLGIKHKEKVYITGLLKKGKKVNGAIGIGFNSGKIIVFHAKAVILATGGHSRLYRASSMRKWEGEGFGSFLALENGLELMDMEMVQFHPTGMVWPQSVLGSLVTEAVRAEGGRLFNSKNERFMKKYDPKRMELSARDVVARANFMEIMKGNTGPHGGVWLDITNRPKGYILKRLPTMYAQFQKHCNIDISKERMEVAPTAHYSMGGISVDPLDCSTELKGLYAVGEVSGGLHGGNRLGGNSLAEIIVFGKIAGEKAAEQARTAHLSELEKSQISKEIKKIENIFEGKKVSPKQLKAQLQETMWRHAGVVRDKKSIEEGLEKIKEIKEQLKDMKVKKGLKKNQELITALDTMALVAVAETVIKSALIRTESRAAHYRTDFKKTNDKQWKANIYCRKQNNKLVFSRRKTPSLSLELKKAIVQNNRQKHRLLE